MNIIQDFDVNSIVQEIKRASEKKDYNYFCTSRDIFQARLDSYILQTKEYLGSAVIGEIGNNTFDHNWEYKDGYVRGTYFNTDNDKLIILADFGQGLRNSLSSVRQINSDLDAIKIAFTERLSGRSPEQRGNGLKFVCESVKEKQWTLYFQSGKACCVIKETALSFMETSNSVIGCLAIFKL